MIFHYFLILHHPFRAGGGGGQFLQETGKYFADPRNPRVEETGPGMERGGEMGQAFRKVAKDLTRRAVEVSPGSMILRALGRTRKVSGV